MEQILEIKLFGQSYQFKAEKDIKSAKEVADFLMQEVNRVEAQIPNKSKNINNLATLILTALNITNEYLELKRNHGEFLQGISERSTTLINRIEDSLQ